jgi:exonuclease SbcC
LIVEKLRLRNFRSYKDQEVAFEPGVTLFEGDIGSGKSSLLFAIEFALFGLADVPGEHLLRAGEKEGAIELQFRSGGRQYTVGRRLTRSKAGGATQKDAFLVVDGVKEDYSVEQLRAAVIKVLGFRENAATKSKSQVFRYGVFTPQEEMKAILEQGAEERKQTLRRAFGIEEYKRARENADMLKQALRERAAGFEAVLAGVGRLEEERQAAFRERAMFESQVKGAQAQRTAAQAQRKEAEERLRACEAIEARERDAERALSTIEVERTKLAEQKLFAESRLKELASLEGEVEPLKEAAAAMPRLEEEVAAAEAKEEERRKLDQELFKVETRLKSLEARKDEIAQESEMLRKVTDSSNEIQEGKRALDEARKALEKVREEAAAAREAADRAASLKVRLAALEKEAGAAEGLTAKLNEREAAAKEGEAAAREFAALEEKLRAAQEAQGSARTALARVEGDLEEMTGLKGKARCPKCKQELNEAHLAEHKRELEEAAKAARTKLAQAQSQGRTLDKQKGALEKAREAGERASRERATLAAELKRSLQAAEEAKVAAKELALAERAGVRSEELSKARRDLEHGVAGKLNFERRAAELDIATKRWREVSDQYRKVVKDNEDTAKAAREVREKRAKSGADPAALKRLRELLSTAKARAMKLKDLERRLQQRGDLEKHRKAAEADLAALDQQAALKRAEREELARKLKDAPVRALRSLFESAAAKAAMLEERLKGAEEGLALQRAALERAEARLAEASSSRAKLDQVRHTRDFIEQCFQVALEDVELKVLRDLNAQLNARFQGYFARLMEGAPVDVQIDSEFSPAVLQGANALPVAALSGGERTSIALAYRLALNTLVSRAAGMETPDLLILDEPTDGFSKEQLARVGELIRDLDCQQVVLVSHERELEGCADQVFEVVKDGTVSRVLAR